jgi:hypothetical protein
MYIVYTYIYDIYIHIYIYINLFKYVLDLEFLALDYISAPRYDTYLQISASGDTHPCRMTGVTLPHTVTSSMGNTRVSIPRRLVTTGYEPFELVNYHTTPTCYSDRMRPSIILHY